MTRRAATATRSKELRRKWARLRARSPSERAVLLEAAAALLALRAVVRLVPYRRWRHLLQIPRTRATPVRRPPAPADRTAALGRILDVAARQLPGTSSCLVRCLALQAMLWRRGLQAEIRFGATAPGPGFEAHCWLEAGGAPVYGEAPGRYHPFRSWRRHPATPAAPTAVPAAPSAPAGRER